MLHGGNAHRIPRDPMLRGNRHRYCVLFRDIYAGIPSNRTYLRGVSEDKWTNTALREGTAEGINGAFLRLRVTISHRQNAQSLAEGSGDENVQDGLLVHQRVDGILRFLDRFHGAANRACLCKEDLAVSSLLSPNCPTPFPLSLIIDDRFIQW